MSQKVAAATGAYSAAATWNSITNTPTLHASTNVTIDTTARFTATFTAPNVINACTGVLVYINAKGTGGTVTVTLQESTVDTAAARTLNIVDLVANSWVYFRFATPYTFTTTGAGAYRFKIQAAAPAGTTNAAADSGGSLYCYLATDDRTGVPGTTDDIWIVGHNQATAITVTMDGTQTIGSGTDTTGINRRTIGAAIVINNSGLLVWDTAASATLTCRGNILSFSGGELRMGTVATPYPVAFVATLNFNENGTSVRYGLETHDNGKLTLQGVAKSSTSLWKTTYSSGLGTAASPMIVADAVDWAVGDEIIVCAYSANATNYNESENKFIITKNSATSYVLSDAAGGAEAALAFTHTAGAYIINVTRNVIIKSTTTTESFYYYNNNTIAGDIDIDWVRFETVGANTTNKAGVQLSNGPTVQFAVDYSVAYRPLFTGFNIAGSNNPLITMTGLIACNSTSTGFTNSGVNKTFVDCFAVKNNGLGWSLSGGGGHTYTRCITISNNTAAGSNGGISLNNQSKSTFNSCEAHCNRARAVTFSAVPKITFNNFLCGTKGTNSTDIVVNGTNYVEAVFVNSTFGSATFISGYAGLLTGSEIAFHTLNGTTNNHTWYTPQGIARSTGAGLVDTTNKTVGNLTVRLAPEDLINGFVWEFLVGIKANTAASIFGFAQKNVAFGTDVVTVELFLPGSTVADATVTLDDTTGAWQVFNLAANYTGSVAAFATVRITAKTATAAAYVYFTDFYNGTNVLTGLQAWYNGKPTLVMTDLLGDPASVWAILESTQTTVGTMGYEISNDLATLRSDVDDLQARIPATLDGGNIRASVKAMDAGVITSSVIATNAIDADALAADAIAEIQSGLSTLTAAQVVTAIFAQMLEGVTYEEIIKDIWAQVVGDAVANDATNPTLLEYDGPNGAVQVTHTRTPTTRTKV